MDIPLGNLKFVPAKDHPELMGSKTAEAIFKMSASDQAKIGVTEIDPGFSDTAAFCAEYKLEMNKAANCVILEAKRADKEWLAACVIPGNTRADVNGLARRTLDARRVSFAPMDKAVTETGMEYGAINPIGLPDSWTILVDQAAADSHYVIIGSGIRKTKLAIPGHLFAALPNVQIVNGLGRIAEQN